MTRLGRTPRTIGGDRGSVSVELVILAPLVGILLAFVVLVGRVESARADLEGAAHAAARDLSLARDPTAAISDARAMVETTLHVGSPTCRTMTLTPVLSAEQVTVTVTCQVDLAEAAVLPIPGSMTVSATATEVIDRYREANP